MITDFFQKNSHKALRSPFYLDFASLVKNSEKMEHARNVRMVIILLCHQGKLHNAKNAHKMQGVQEKIS
jgi:hypothetical protein